MLNTAPLIPYTLLKDSWIVMLLVVCFVATAWAWHATHGAFLQRFQSFAVVKDRGSFFDETVNNRFRVEAWFFVQSLLMLSLAGYSLIYRQEGFSINFMPPIAVVIIGALVLGGITLLKNAAYRLLGWLFLSPLETSVWVNAYHNLLSALGIGLLIFNTLSVTLSLKSEWTLYMLVALFIICKIVMLFGWFRLFSIHSYGYVLIIVYFCALELLPYYMFYVSRSVILDVLLLKS
ncbi:MAG TPA: DUF4271 domain-containing protein [Bacteroidaceae bacterium]|nr:DUF4271 domain-containing protein [Bacteroidaceae bacterium]